MAGRIAITILCGVGLYAAIFMLRKSRRADRGEIEGPSVVKTPQAKLLGPPNALIGASYYPLILIAIWGMPALAASGFTGLSAILGWLAAIAAVAAGLMSVALAYSLLFITKRWCPYCWVGHFVNWSLLVLIFLLPRGI